MVTVEEKHFILRVTILQRGLEPDVIISNNVHCTYPKNGGIFKLILSKPKHPFSAPELHQRYHKNNALKLYT